MKLGTFDQNKAQQDAKLILQKSISSLQALLDCDSANIGKESINPFEQEDARFYGFEILKSEIEAYRKL